MSKIYLIVGFLLVLILTVAVFFSSVWNPIQLTKTIQPTSTPVNTISSIHILSPKSNDVIEGTVTVNGTVQHKNGDFTIEIRNNNHIVGTDHVAVAQGAIDWAKQVYITTSVESVKGEVVVYPTEEGSTSHLTRRVPIEFDAVTIPDRLVVYAPLKNQLMTGPTLHIAGKMKGFFEGILHVRLIDDKNTVIFKDVIHAKSDNYQEFALFSKDVKFGTIISTTLHNGSWQFYDISAKDESETILATVSIRFKK